MSNIAYELEKAIWGENNVPPYIKRQLGNLQPPVDHKNHIQCDDTSCVL